MTARWVPVTADRRGPVVPAGHWFARRWLNRNEGRWVIDTVPLGSHGTLGWLNPWGNEVTHICDLGTDPEAEVPAFVEDERRDLPPEVDALLGRLEEALLECDRIEDDLSEPWGLPREDHWRLLAIVLDALPDGTWLEAAEALRKMREGRE